MLPTPENYTIWPSVLPAGKRVRMTITAAERAFLPQEGAVYTIIIIPVGEDEPSYYHPSSFTALTAEAHDGVICFEHIFQGEMEHLIVLYQGEKRLQKMVVYALEEDLYGLIPFKGDFHAHSYRSDGKRDPAALAGHYREQGYDFLALTDHNRYYSGGEIDEAYAGVATGLHHVQGEEIHAPTICVHIVHVGGEKSVAEFYVHNREAYEQEATAYMAAVPEHIPEQYRERYSKVMWAADRIHEAGGMAIFPHPYWRPGSTKMNNVDVHLARLILTSGKIDAYELLGAMTQMGNNLSVALWSELRAEGYDIPVVGSSDVHEIEKSERFPHIFTICLAEDNEDGALMEAVRQHRSVAVAASGEDYGREYRCYGKLRMVTYAQYLLHHYFPRLQRISQGTGTAMRAYAMEEVPAAAIEHQTAMAEDFRLRFFGRKEAQKPSKGLLAWESKWRDVQKNGPLSKGSEVYIPPEKQNYQI